MASFGRYRIPPQWFTIVPEGGAVYPVLPQSPRVNLYILYNLQLILEIHQLKIFIRFSSRPATIIGHTGKQTVQLLTCTYMKMAGEFQEEVYMYMYMKMAGEFQEGNNISIHIPSHSALYRTIICRVVCCYKHVLA